MNEQNHLYGHLAAGFSIFVWGTTFISTKVLLEAFTPLEILFFRFLIGYAALWLACPPLFRTKSKKQECLFAAAGICGVTLYFLMVSESKARSKGFRPWRKKQGSAQN
jgi:drug/metabolite transporter (DMT)-like permease